MTDTDGMAAPSAKDVNVFVPAKDFKLSRDFYTELDWTCNWQHEEGLAELELADCRFYLQNFYVEEWANNFMIYVVVDDAQEWFEHVTEVLSGGAFPGARVQAPVEEDYGASVTFVWDPSGVLLHFAQPH